MNFKEYEIALIHPEYKNKVKETLSIPLGLAWISAYLKINEIKTKCFDMAMSQDDEKEFLKGDYPIVCYQLHSDETLVENLEYLKYLKRFKQRSIFIVGGIAATLNHANLVHNKDIDFIILGEGEVALTKLIRDIQKNNSINYANLESIKGLVFKYNGDIVNTGEGEIIDDLNSLPLPDREAFNPSRYSQCSIITSRGCPHKCSFCTIPAFYKGRVRFRSPEEVINEILHLHKIYNMKKFFILDDTFTLNAERVEEFCNLLIKTERKFEWACLSRIDLINDRILILLKRAGCVQISFGVETINQISLNRLNKKLDVSLIPNAIELTKKYNIRTRCSFIFGLPFEDEKDILNTINFILQYQPDEVQIYPYVPYRKTEITEELIKTQGLNVDNINYENKNALEPMIEPMHIKRYRLIELTMECINKLKERGYIWMPGDKTVGKHNLDKVVMTSFCPIQTLK